MALVLVSFAGGEARHGVGQDVGARQTQQVDRLGGDDQRVGRVEAAGHADHHPLDACRSQPLHEPGDLDVVGLVAILREALAVRRHEREALDRAARSPTSSMGGSSLNGDPAIARPSSPRGAGGCRRTCPGGSAPGAGGRGRRRRAPSGRRPESARSRRAARRSRRSRSARPRRGRWSTRPRPPRNRRRPRRSGPIAPGRAGARVSALPMVMLQADRLASTVAPASAASQLGGTGTQKSSQISAWTTKPGTSSAAKIRSGPNGASMRTDPDRPAVGSLARGEMPVLVELAVVRQMDFRRHPEQAAAVDGERAVIDAVAVAQRRADEQHGQQLCRASHQRCRTARSTASSSAS